jgi:8-oxo-dGTP pyrophosphatase MutT (NUDIX family)
MGRDQLLSLLKKYIPSDGAEQTMHQDTIVFVQANPECFERSLTIGHITASGWVVSPDRAMALLMHHRKLDKWFQPGGHCDGDPNVAAVAEKEIMEETGVEEVRIINPEIFDIDIHLIPANTKDHAHFHYDIRFLFEADPLKKITANFESKDVKWVALDDVEALNNSDSIMRMVTKTKMSVPAF